MKKHLRLIPLIAILAACDNAQVSVTDGGWQAIEMRTAQRAPDPRFPTTDLAQGNGPEVRAGELVKFRIYGYRVYADGRDLAPAAWYWTGYLPEDRWQHGPTEPTTLGALLVGRRVGDRFLLEPKGGELYPEQPRLSGLAPPTRNRPGIVDMQLFTDYSADLENYSLRKSTLEIVASCPVHLSIREGTMTQWGYILNLFEMAYETNRHDALYWTAIDADCPLPDGAVRFMNGPMHFTPAFDGVHPERNPRGQLYNWQDAYRAQRPSSRYPDEYQHVLIGDQWIHRDVHNQQVVDIATPVARHTIPAGGVAASKIEAAAPPSESDLKRDRTEGRIWAVDNNIGTAAECTQGSPAFIEGCTAAIAARPGSDGK